MVVIDGQKWMLFENELSDIHYSYQGMLFRTRRLMEFDDIVKDNYYTLVCNKHLRNKLLISEIGMMELGFTSEIYRKIHQRMIQYKKNRYLCANQQHNNGCENK